MLDSIYQFVASTNNLNRAPSFAAPDAIVQVIKLFQKRQPFILMPERNSVEGVRFIVI